LQPSSSYPLTYVVCDGDHFGIWSGVQYVLQGLFLFYGVFLAIMTRKLPSAYNEATYLGLSTYNVAFSSCLTLPIVYLTSSEDTLTAMYVLTSIVILWGVDFTMMLLIIPRLYFIYKKIAPDQRFLEEMGYRKSRGAYSPRDKRTNSPGSGGTDNGGAAEGNSSKAANSASKPPHMYTHTPTDTPSVTLKQPLLDERDAHSHPKEGEDDDDDAGIVEIHATIYHGLHSEVYEESRSATNEHELTPQNQHRRVPDRGTTIVHHSPHRMSASLLDSSTRGVSKVMITNSGIEDEESQSLGYQPPAVLSPST